ncbi:MAG: glucosaminidase domain-containing protein [Candidatus Cloacimonetes bacterium]|nr:glucosaminidase domain-containing protein [Candidatus Cloacimonadota bacterium]
MDINNFPHEAAIRYVLQRQCIDAMGAYNVPSGWEKSSIARKLRDACIMHKVDPVLALAQGIMESHFAVNPYARRSRKHKNIFNWLNTDDGKNHTFASFEDGIEQYCKTMSREYYWADDPDKGLPGWVTLEMMLRHDFTRPKGGRYASAWEYTMKIRKLSATIKKNLLEGAKNG